MYPNKINTRYDDFLRPMIFTIKYIYIYYNVLDK